MSSQAVYPHDHGRPPMLPTDSAERKNLPVVTGVIDYFPLAIAEVARLSKIGNDKHNPGQRLHWNRPLSADHADTLGRHLIERGTIDTDGVRHSAKVAWRALAILQLELEEAREGVNPAGPLTPYGLAQLAAQEDRNFWLWKAAREGTNDVERIVTMPAHDDLHNHDHDGDNGQGQL